MVVAEAEREEQEAKAKGEKENYKGDSKFAEHLKSSKGVSAFAKSRTLKEQREYLPAFACREELMKVIRENQGIKLIFGFIHHSLPSQSSLLSVKLVPERRHNSRSSCTRMVIVAMVLWVVPNLVVLLLCRSLNVSARKWRFVAHIYSVLLND